MELRNYLIRNIDAGDLIESFLVAAVTSLLGVRFYLSLTGYPKVGFGLPGLHIAHMLWGGLFMLIAILLILNFLNKPILRISAIIGGLGFGLFIDELGKFITHDSNYFFQPTIVFLYVIFILLFLLVRMVEKHQIYTQKEYLMNALEMLEEAVLGDMNTDEKKLTLSLLRKSDSDDPVVIGLKALMKNIEAVPIKESTFAKIRRIPRSLYHSLIASRWFTRILVWFFVGKSIISLFSIPTLFVFLQTNINLLSQRKIAELSFIQSGEVVFSTLSSMFVLLGVGLIGRSRLHAYQMFKRSILVTIFFTQFFIFYREQLSAVIGLFFNIIILLGLQYAITEEQAKQSETSTSS